MTSESGKPGGMVFLRPRENHPPSGDIPSGYSDCICIISTKKRVTIYECELNNIHGLMMLIHYEKHLIAYPGIVLRKPSKSLILANLL